MSPGHGLAPAERVRRRPDFERAYETGLRIHARFMTLFVVANGGVATRLGVAATRKLGSAVERNRAKRLAREIFRRHKAGTGLDIVIVPRREMLDASFARDRKSTRLNSSHLGISYAVFCLKKKK